MKKNVKLLIIIAAAAVVLVGVMLLLIFPVSYTHLTLPTTPYV